MKGSDSTMSLACAPTAWPWDAKATAQAGGILHGARKIWLGEHKPGLQARLFRRHIHSASPTASVQLYLTAESYYHLWVNGRYVTRGPIFHHTDILPVAKIDLSQWWKPGDNVVAILVFTPGFPTHKVMTGEPGLWAAVHETYETGETSWTLTDESWKVSDRVGWHQHVVRHGWALGPIEVLDASAHTWGWQDPSFDDNDWAPAQYADGSNGSTQIQTILDLPPLTIGWADAQDFLGAWRVGRDPAPLEPEQSCELIGEWIHREPWKPIPPDAPVSTSWDLSSGCLAVNGLENEYGLALVLDMGQERVGNIAFDFECESKGLVEVGWSEVIADGKPAMIHKDTAYVDRLLARPGRQRWDALQFTGLRYVVLILRGFKGSVRISGVGVRTSTSVPSLKADFISSDRRLNDIWNLCANTLCIGTQETIIDCPSREQAPYLGDGHLVGQWLGLLNGDYRHWRYLLQLGFGSQADDGLMRDAPLFPVRRSLIDYVLLTVMAVREYVHLTGEEDFGRNALDGCRRAVGYFDAQCGKDGMLTAFQFPGARLVPWDVPGPPRRTPSLDPHLFIDHAGLGGHNVGDPGIERRGRSAALNAFYSLALESLSDLERQFGSPSEAVRRKQMAEQVRSAAAAAYWDDARGMFVDAVDEHGRRSEMASQQTNILAALAEWPCPHTPRELVRRVLRPKETNAQCGPYFYAYLLPLMHRLGMHTEALSLIREKWGPMLDAGATTLWETFCGDGHDTWCHPWAAIPAAFLTNHILGLNACESGSKEVVLRPRYDLLPSAGGLIPTEAGPLELKWVVQGSVARLSGVVPPGMRGTLFTCDGGESVSVSSAWELDLPLPAPCIVTNPVVVKRRSSIYT